MATTDASSGSTRSSPRIPFNAEVKLVFERFSRFLSEYASNISSGGMFIVSDKPEPVGTPLSFEFSLSDEYKLISGTAEVVWVREESPGSTEPPGMAVVFREMDQESRELINQMVDNHLREGGELFDPTKPPKPPKPDAPVAAAPSVPLPPVKQPKAEESVFQLPDIDAALSQDLPAGVELNPGVPAATKAQPEPPVAAAPPPANAPLPVAAPPSIPDAGAKPQPEAGEGLPDIEGLMAQISSESASPQSFKTQQIPRRKAEDLAMPLIVPVDEALPTVSRGAFVAGGSKSGSGWRKWSALGAIVVGLGAVGFFYGDQVLQRLGLGGDGTAETGTAETAEVQQGAADTTETIDTADTTETIDTVDTPSSDLKPVESRAVAATPATKVESISWRRSDGATLVTLEGDGAMAPANYEATYLPGRSPRQVVKIRGIRQRYAGGQLEVGSAEISGIRTGVHEGPGGSELHIVFDLVSENIRLSDEKFSGPKLLLWFQPAAAN